jgi:hypothetical protein
MHMESMSERDAVLDTVWLVDAERDELERCATYCDCFVLVPFISLWPDQLRL